MRGQNSGNPGKKEVELNPMGARKIYLDDVVGQEQAKKQARKFLRMIENRDLVNYYGLEIPNMAFFGPPGTGKTMMTQAMAHRCLNRLEDTLFVSLNLQGFATCFINETSNNFDSYMNNIKEEMMSDSPFKHFVIFMDEYDSIGRTRGMDMHGEDDKLTNAINAYMDGERKVDGVNYIVASNFPDLIDAAQRNRFGIHAKFELFKNYEDKAKLFKIHERMVRRKSEHNFFDNIDYMSLSKKLKGEISGREIRDLTNRAVQNKLFDMIGSKNTIEENLNITYSDFEKTIDEYLTERQSKRGIGII